MNLLLCLIAFIFSMAIVPPGVADAPNDRSGINPPRIVSLAPNITEIICAIGAEKTLVGRTSACDYPRDALRKIPAIGGFGAPSLESLVAVRPTIVLAVDLEDESIAGRLNRYGIDYRRLACNRLAEIPATIRIIGEITDCVLCAEQVAADFEKRLEILRAASEKKSATSKISVFAEIWSDPLMTAGAGSLVDDLIVLAGGRNIAGEVGKEYFAVSPEWVIARDPDVIVCLDHVAVAKIETRPGWKQLKAVRSGRVLSAVDNNLFLRAGPRVLDGAAVLSNFIAGKGTNAALTERRLK